MKEFKVFSLDPSSHHSCSDLRDLLNESWTIHRVDRSCSTGYGWIVYILERLK